MTANNMEAAVRRTPLVEVASVAVAEVVSPSFSPSVVEVVVEVSVAERDKQVDESVVEVPNTWVEESQAVQTAAEVQVVHPVGQAVHLSKAEAVAAVEKDPAAHSQAVFPVFKVNPVAHDLHSSPAVAVQVKQPLAQAT